VTGKWRIFRGKKMLIFFGGLFLGSTLGILLGCVLGVSASNDAETPKDFVREENLVE
jgi:hypothetical protein